MKKVLLIAFILPCIASFAQTFKARQVQGTKTTLVENNITYEKDLDLLYVEVDGTSQETYLQLNKAERDTLKKYLIKFKEFAAPAEAANETSDKPIGTMVCSGGFKIGETIYSHYAAKVDLYFYSYKGQKKGKAELSMTIPSFASSKNKDIISGSRTIVLSSQAVNQLLNGVDNEKIAERILKQKSESEIIR